MCWRPRARALPRMRLLLDESVPAKLARLLPNHEVRTVVEMGWSGVKLHALKPLLPSLEEELAGLNPRAMSWCVAKPEHCSIRRSTPSARLSR
jgi:hypothetical protein